MACKHKVTESCMVPKRRRCTDCGAYLHPLANGKLKEYACLGLVPTNRGRVRECKNPVTHIMADNQLCEEHYNRSKVAKEQKKLKDMAAAQRRIDKQHMQNFAEAARRHRDESSGIIPQRKVDSDPESLGGVYFL